MLKIALPNKGSLSEGAIRLVSEAGYNCKRYGRELKIIDTANDVEFIFLRPRDIAIYVSNGILDLGITGRDLAIDSEANLAELLSMGFAKSKFFYAVPNGSDLSPETFSGITIATSYPNLVAGDLAKRNIDAKIIRLDGAIEISINLGVADAIADVVQTGRTMVEAGLKTVGGSVLDSEAVLVGRTGSVADKDQVSVFIERLRGIIVAREYVMIEYDVEKENLESACVVTPGIEAPTVAPLRKDNWYAVKSMIRKEEINRIMDELVKLGAKGIIATCIKTCRI